MGTNIMSSLPCTSVGIAPMVSRGDAWVVGSGDVVEDVGGQVSSQTMDRD